MKYQLADRPPWPDMLRESFVTQRHEAVADEAAKFPCLRLRQSHSQPNLCLSSDLELLRVPLLAKITIAHRSPCGVHHRTLSLIIVDGDSACLARASRTAFSNDATLVDPSFLPFVVSLLELSSRSGVARTRLSSCLLPISSEAPLLRLLSVESPLTVSSVRGSGSKRGI